MNAHTHTHTPFFLTETYVDSLRFPEGSFPILSPSNLLVIWIGGEKKNNKNFHIHQILDLLELGRMYKS